MGKGRGVRSKKRERPAHTTENNTHATMQRGHASGSDRNARASSRFVMMCIV